MGKSTDSVFASIAPERTDKILRTSSMTAEDEEQAHKQRHTNDQSHYDALLLDEGWDDGEDEVCCCMYSVALVYYVHFIYEKTMKHIVIA